jgi:HTH-type transcriptional regulator/antitoxin MqsA
MPSPETGEPMKYGVRPFTVTYKGHSITVDQPGYYPDGEGEGVVVGPDMHVATAALRELKQLVDGIPTPETIKQLRAA